MDKKKWNRGRLGICPDGKGRPSTFNICPTVWTALDDFCRQSDLRNKSLIVNEAIRSYIERNQNVPT